VGNIPVALCKGADLGGLGRPVREGPAGGRFRTVARQVVRKVQARLRGIARGKNLRSSSRFAAEVELSSVFPYQQEHVSGETSLKKRRRLHI